MAATQVTSCVDRGQMREIGVRELRRSLSETLRAVGQDEQVRVTLRGRPVANIVPRRRCGGQRSVPRARRGGPGRAAGEGAANTGAQTSASPPQRVGGGALRAGRRALNVYLDASALVKRYVAEPATDVVLDAVQRAEGWCMCRAGSSGRFVLSGSSPGFARPRRSQTSGPRSGSSKLTNRSLSTPPRLRSSVSCEAATRSTSQPLSCYLTRTWCSPRGTVACTRPHAEKDSPLGDFLAEAPAAAPPGTLTSRCPTPHRYAAGGP